MSLVKGFFGFWYDFIVGDDWKIAVAVVSVLLAGAVIVHSGTYDDAWVLAPLLAFGIGAAFTAAVLIDVRTKPK